MDPRARWIVRHFEVEELRRLVRDAYEDVVHEVQWREAPADVAAKLCERLDHHGLGGRELYDRLRAWRPQLVAEVDALEDTVLGDDHEAASAWRAFNREAHARLVPFFQDKTAKVLDDVYVVLDVRAESRMGRMDTCRSVRALLSDREGGAPRWLLLGEPGAGKSTMLRHLAWAAGAWGGAAWAAPGAGPAGLWASRASAAGSRPAATNWAPLVAFVPLAALRFEESAGSVRVEGDWAAQAAGLYARAPGAVPARRVERALRRAARAAGGAWLLLDGLDEVAEARAGAVRTWIAAQAQDPRLAVLVSSRPISARDPLDGPFLHARVERLDAPRQEELVRNLLDAEAGPLLQELDASPALRELGGNPLLLTMLAFLSRDARLRRQSAPTTRRALYEQAITALLRRGFAAEPVKVAAPTLLREVLEHLSLHLQEARGEAWTERALDDALWAIREDPRLERKVKGTNAYEGDNDRLLAALGKDTGILGPHDGPGGDWRYLHRSLREFLAAERLVAKEREAPGAFDAWEAGWVERAVRARKAEGESSPEAEEARRSADRWGEVYVMACGALPDPLARVRRLRGVDSALAQRALAAVEGVAPRDALACLFEEQACREVWDAAAAGWRDETLLALARAWGPAGAEALWEAVAGLGGTGTRAATVRAEGSTEGQPSLPEAPFRRAVLGYALEVVGAFEAGRFFDASGLVGGRPALVRCEVPGGRFVMGSERGHEDERPRHEVTLSRPYALSRTPVTNEQYQALVPDHAPGEDGALPVAYVSWYEARLYAAWVGGRLPTEAEWERACRGGNDAEQDYWSGDGEGSLAAVGWYVGNSGSERQPAGRPPGSGTPAAAGRPSAVGKPAAVAAPEHPWRLLDLHGNVWEWCEDWYGPYGSDATDPRGPGAGMDRVLRGGGAWGVPGWCRSACRFRNHPGRRVGNIGFRVCFPAPSRSSLDP